jgi:uncharacterized repeat protein (TIGR02543 family)
MKLTNIISILLSLIMSVLLMTSLTTFSEETDTTAEPTTTTETLPSYEEHDCFYLIYDTQGYEASADLSPRLLVKGNEVTITSASIYREGYVNYAWTDGENVYLNGSTLIMPGHNVTLTPLFHKIYKITYTAGNYDDISGSTEISFDRHESFVFDLANSTRFSRSGFNLTYWLDVETNEKYKPISQYQMPSRDVVLEAVWEPITYNIMFSSNTPVRESFTVAGTYGTEITLPLCRFKYEGYKFVGWTYGSTLYKAGDKFTVPAALPGLSIALKAKWEPLDGTEEADVNVFSYIALKQQIGKGEVTAEEIKNSKAFLLNCKD